MPLKNLLNRFPLATKVISLDDLFVQSRPTDIKRKRVKARFYAFRLLPLTTILTKMPPTCTPLGFISKNRPKGCEISPYMRGQVIGQAFKGAKPTEIARDLKLDRSTINYTLYQDELRNDGHSLLQKPRCKLYTNAEERLCVRHIRFNLKDTYKQVIEACNLRCKRETVKKILKRHSIANWRAKKRLKLIEAHALKRLA